MQVTVMCDASHCPDTLIAGYGFWIVSSRGGLPGAGAIYNVDSSLTAEMLAVGSAVFNGLSDGFISWGDKLLIQLDCLGAIDRFEKSKKGIVITNTQHQAIGYFDHILKEYDLEVEFRHVKAHTADTSKRSNSNRLCDRRARKAMRTARDAYKEELCLNLSLQ